MDNSEKPEIGFLIELAITGQANAKQFNEVMDRIENEPEIAALYEQALAEHQLLETQISASKEILVQEQADEFERGLRELEEKQQLDQQNNLDLEI